MQYKAIVQLVQTVINSIQNTGIFLAQQIRNLAQSTFSVKVTNPQEKVEVSGEVTVNQKGVEDQLKNNALAIRELKKPLSALKVVEVSNMPTIPDFPEFPKKMEITNPQKDVKINNMDEFVEAVDHMCDMMMKMDMAPKVNVQAPVVNIPKVDAPIVNVKAPVVNVDAPDMSEFKRILEFLKSISVKKPLAVRLSDGVKFYKALEKMAEIYAGSTFSAFKGPDGAEERALVDGDGHVQVNVMSSLPTQADMNASIILTYADGNLTQIEKTIGTTVYTKTLTYTDGNLTGVSMWS